MVKRIRPGSLHNSHSVMFSCFNIPIDMKTVELASRRVEFGMMIAPPVQLSKKYA
jgi:hypothetical protein